MQRTCVEAGPAFPRCRVHRRADGPTRAVHRCRARARRRSLHAPSLRSFGREERLLITERTKAALAAKKPPGATLGNRTNIGVAGQAGRRALRAEADRFAANLLPIIRSIQSAGPIGMVSIAKMLNERGIRTARGGQWHVSSVANLLARANNCAAG